MLAIGLMSGTSLDGIDAALVRITPSGASYALELLNFATLPFDDELDTLLRAALPPHAPGPSAVAHLHHRLGSAFARAARMVAGALRVDYVASHGQTIYHDGPRHFSVQIGDPFVIRETLNATVIYDFRSGDCAAGGHGAPLVPYVDGLLLASPSEDRVALNVGGIANVTSLPAGCDPYDVMAFDCGPGVMLLDAFVQTRSEGELTMDVDGAFAAAGMHDGNLLRAMLGDDYFAQPPPKSTGRERFGATFLAHHAATLGGLSLEDGCATLVEVTATAIAAAIVDLRMAHARVLVSGGGARNLALLDRLRAMLPDAALEPTDAYGLPVDAKEAMAFAVLGYETLRERAANVPRVTGASRAVPLGAIAPSDLRGLLAEVERECR